MYAKRTNRLVGSGLGPFFFSGLIAASWFVGCNSVIGLDQFSIAQTGGAAGTSSPTSTTTGGAGKGGGGSGGATGGEVDAAADVVEEPRIVECHTNKECTDRATAAAIDRQEAGLDDGGDGGPIGTVPAMCIQSIGKCATLLSPDCQTVTVGDYMDDHAILLGTLFTLTGATGPTNLQRQQSATLAFEEINTKGGLPPAVSGGPRRPIVVLSCNEAPNATRAATHLVDDLHVAALVGPNTSQDTIDLSNKVSIMGGTVMMTPSAVASSIADLQDDDLTWLMAPSDVQRAPLMIQQINELETQLKAARNKTTVKIGVIYRDDALGQGTQIALTALQINGKSLTDNVQLNTASIDKYLPTAPNQDALIAKYRTFAPDIIALAGTAEAITAVMQPLEAAWNADAGIDRPYYVTIDSAKVPELLTAAASVDLRGRVRGTGTTQTDQSKVVYDAFVAAYIGRYSTPTVQTRPTASSTGPSYDAAYSIAYAIAAIKDMPITGPNVALGLRKLAGGSTVIEVGSTKILAAFQKLTAGGDGGGENITAIGTFGPLEWNAQGAPVSAKLEVWCIGSAAGAAAFASSGLSYDLKTQQFSGMYTPSLCQ